MDFVKETFGIEDINIIQYSHEKKIPILKIALTTQDDTLKIIYEQCVIKHNENIMNNIYFDSGFDVYFPENIQIPTESKKSCLVNLKVKCEMFQVELGIDSHEKVPLPFYLYPRSSISKTPLILANHVGIIDSGYRGNLMVALRNLDSNNYYECLEYTRLFQICKSDLMPFLVCLVNENKLSNTKRNDGGFGSTGI